jgi:hypothetical protein
MGLILIRLLLVVSARNKDAMMQEHYKSLMIQEALNNDMDEDQIRDLRLDD